MPASPTDGPRRAAERIEQLQLEREGAISVFADEVLDIFDEERLAAHEAYDAYWTPERRAAHEATHGGNV